MTLAVPLLPTSYSLLLVGLRRSFVRQLPKLFVVVLLLRLDAGRGDIVLCQGYPLFHFLDVNRQR